MKEDKTGILIAATLFLISLPFLAIYSGFVLSYLWLWFIVPLGVPAIAIGHAIGIMTIKNFVFYKYQKEKTEKGTSEDVYKALTALIVSPSVALGIGYIIKTWFM